MLKNRHSLKTVAEAFDPARPIVVSVIVDTFNHANYLKENLDSILSQLVDFNIEILIHDDCSKDNTQEIIRDYERKYPQIIKPIYQKEIDAAFNYPRIKGQYVAMCEGDDKWIDDYKLFKQTNYLNKHPKISAYIAKTIRYNMRDNKYGFYGLAVDKRSKKYTLKDLVRGKDFSVSSFLARKEFFVPPFPKFINLFVGFTDIQLGYYFALHNKIYYDCHPMSFYRQYSSQTSFTASFSKLDLEKKIRTYENRIKVLELLGDVIPSKYKKDLEKRIRLEKFTNLVIINDVEALKTKEFKKMYNRKMRHEKIKKFLNIKH